ncbi:exonuclease domain-containing protein, partial [Francisella tularensis]|uniref:exonuclease domain-containing protein n=1 Tax=Francisella tularensis TaxID=263 RepID=UPI002381A018
AYFYEWCIKSHTESGITQRVIDSKISTEDAEQQILEFIRKFVPYQSSPLCGNSICQDRRFLSKYMQNIDEYCHYRI